MPELAPSHFDRFLRPILASRFFTISAIVHLLIILLFGGKVLFNKYVEPPDFQPTGDTMVSTDTPPAPPRAPPGCDPASDESLDKCAAAHGRPEHDGSRHA